MEEQAKKTLEKYARKYRRLSRRVMNGDKTSALEAMRTLTERNHAMRALGYEWDEGVGWNKRSPRPPTAYDELLRRAFEGDREAAVALLKTNMPCKTSKSKSEKPGNSTHGR